MKRQTLVPLPVLEHPAPTAAGSHFTELGAEPAVTRLVERFYHYMDTLPEAAIIRAMHPLALDEVRAVLSRYFVEWLGGPPLYSAERGHPRLRMRHARFAIGTEERDAWMMCMRRALLDTVPAPALRETLERKLFELADMLRNLPEGC
jgi:hemoglobin